MTKGGPFSPLPPDLTSLILDVPMGLTHVFKRFYVFWLGWEPIVVLYKPELIELVLSSNKLIEKSWNYDLLQPWLGRGLLTNTGDKWRARRKLLTPAFHFKILDDFIPIINEHSLTFVERLKHLPSGVSKDIVPYITSCTLDIICDTAMGIKIDAQNNSDSEYVKSVYVLGDSFVRRTVDMKGWFDPIFFRTEFGKKYLKSLNTLHEFTRKVIRQRKQEIQNRSQTTSAQNSLEVLGRKKRMAFLDLLLEHHLGPNSQLSEEDIREEVDTFMFEGHDTTAMALCWSLYLIGLDPGVQNKIHSELDSVFGDDKTRPVMSDDLNQLKYMECCIKETLRLYPSVPQIARMVDEDMKLDSFMIPKGTTLMLFPYALHRNSDVFPNPEVFKPERFLSENNVSKVNPYSYVPFSAGPRNCIGQRFAMTEEKIFLAQVFRQFKVTSLDTRDKARVGLEIVIRPKIPIRLKLDLR